MNGSRASSTYPMLTWGLGPFFVQVFVNLEIHECHKIVKVKSENQKYLQVKYCETRISREPN